LYMVCVKNEVKDFVKLLFESATRRLFYNVGIAEGPLIRNPPR
jgi:hypothetical protein